MDLPRKCPPKEKWPDYVIEGQDDHEATAEYEKAKEKLQQLIAKNPEEISLEDYRLIDFDFSAYPEYANDYYTALYTYLQFAHKYMRRLRRASALRQNHYLKFIKGKCKREHIGHANFRKGFRNRILPESESLLAYWERELETHGEQVFQKPIFEPVYVPEPVPYTRTQMESPRVSKKERIRIGKAEALKRKQIYTKLARKEQEEMRQQDDALLSQLLTKTEKDAELAKNYPVAVYTLDAETVTNMLKEIVYANTQLKEPTTFSVLQSNVKLEEKDIHRFYKVLLAPFFMANAAFYTAFLDLRVETIGNFNALYAGTVNNVSAIPVFGEYILALDDFEQWSVQGKPSVTAALNSSQGCLIFTAMKKQLNNVADTIKHKSKWKRFNFWKEQCYHVYLAVRYNFASAVLRNFAEQLQRHTKKSDAKVECLARLNNDERLRKLFHLYSEDIPAKQSIETQRTTRRQIVQPLQKISPKILSN